MKSLLLEAYVKGQQELLYVVPFVAKVLESSLRSMVSKIVIAVPSVLARSEGSRWVLEPVSSQQSWNYMDLI